MSKHNKTSSHYVQANRFHVFQTNRRQLESSSTQIKLNVVFDMKHGYMNAQERLVYE